MNKSASQIPVTPGPGPYGGPPMPIVLSVTPEMAAEWFTDRAPNRNVADRHSAALARDMANGNWHPNSETYGFEWLDGRWRLNDGQHRLKAQVSAGVTLNVICVFGATPKGVNVGRVRQYGQQLRMDGVRNGADLAAVLRLCTLWTLGRPPGESTYRPTWDEMEDVRQKHPCIEQSMQVVNQLRNSIGMRSSVAGWLTFVTAHASPGCGLPDDGWFLDRLINGDGLASGHPALTLRNRITADATFRSDVFRLAAGSVYAWNAYREGRDLAIIKVPGNLTPAMFPEVTS